MKYATDAKAARLGEVSTIAPKAPITGNMRPFPISLKLVAVLSLLAEATAAALVFWHTGPRAR